jgi:hypothetical protein
MAHRKFSKEVQECIKDCQDCAAICVETTSHCLEMGGRHAEARHIRTLVDCAEICRVSADFMLRGSEFDTRLCGVCAEVCRSCADSCQRLAGDDELMKRCADMCRRCAESCDRMSGTATRRAG